MPPAAEEHDPRLLAERIEALVQELDALTDARAGARVGELVRLLMELYGAGLARVLQLAAADDGPARALPERLGADPLVASLLVLHGLHPLDARARIERALQELRSRPGPHAVEARLLDLQEDVVRIRFEGSSSILTTKRAIERAVEDAAPEVSRIEILGLDSPLPASPLIRIQIPGPRRGVASAPRRSVPASR